MIIHQNHLKLNKKRKPYKRPCYPREACINGRPNYGKLLFPVCPVLRDILIDKPLYDISKIETTNLPLLDSVNRVRYVLRKLIELKPDEETIVRCAHTKEPYNRNFLTEWLKPIEDDLKTLPEKMQDNFPATSEKLAKLIKELLAVVDSYTIYSRTDLFLQFPSYLFGNDDYGFLVWRSQLTSSKPYGIVDEGGSNKESDALVCASKSAFACTYPIDAIEASRPICEELEEVAKHLDREKTFSSKAVVNTIPQEKARQAKPKSSVDKTRDIKKRFSFNEAQAIFDNTDLGLPSGETVSILERLRDSFGEVVKHNELDQNSSPSNASDILKGRIHTIKKALKRHKIPCRIESKRGVGYVLKKK